MYLVSLRFLCTAHTLHCLEGYFLFPSPPPTIFSSLCIPKSPKSLPGGSCLGPRGVVGFSGNWGSSELDSLRFWTSVIQDLLTSYMKFLYFTLFVFSVLYTKKKCWTAHSFADTIPPFSAILQFSSERSNNWGTGLPCLCPLWIYCTGQQHKASLFPCLFSCLSAVFTIVASWIVLVICTSLALPQCTITSPVLQNADFPFFQALTFPF